MQSTSPIFRMTLIFNFLRVLKEGLMSEWWAALFLFNTGIFSIMSETFTQYQKVGQEAGIKEKNQLF